MLAKNAVSQYTKQNRVKLGFKQSWDTVFRTNTADNDGSVSCKKYIWRGGFHLKEMQRGAKEVHEEKIVPRMAESQKAECQKAEF